jgi:hypothetical protein
MLSMSQLPCRDVAVVECDFIGLLDIKLAIDWVQTLLIVVINQND